MRKGEISLREVLDATSNGGGVTSGYTLYFANEADESSAGERNFWHKVPKGLYGNSIIRDINERDEDNFARRGYETLRHGDSLGTTFSTVGKSCLISTTQSAIVSSGRR